MAEALLCEVLAVVAAYSGLAGLLTMRGTCSALHRRAGPERRELWAAAHPADRRVLLRMGTVECARLLFRVYSFAEDEVRAPHNWTLAIVCYRTPTSVAKWVFDYFGVGTKPNDEQWLNGMATDLVICSNFRVPTMKWLSTQYNIKPSSDSLSMACSDGNIVAVRLAAAYFGFTPNGAQRRELLSWACSHDRLATLRWIVGRFAAEEFDLLFPENRTKRWLRGRWVGVAGGVTA